MALGCAGDAVEAAYIAAGALISLACVWVLKGETGTLDHE